MIEIIILLVIGSLGFLGWKSGIGEFIGDLTGKKITGLENWLTDEGGNWSSLAEELPYREFNPNGDFLETEEGLLWCGIEVTPIATEGFDRDEWWQLANSLNRAFCVPDDAIIEVIHELDGEINDCLRLHDKLEQAAPSEELKIIARARRGYWEQEKARNTTKRSRIFVYFGVLASEAAEQIGLKGMVSSSPWIDLEEEAYRQTYELLQQTRESFISAYKGAGGKIRRLSIEEIRNYIYAGLNPETELSAPLLESVSKARQNVVAARTSGGSNDFKSFISELQSASFLDEHEIDISEIRPTHKRTFNQSPRESLCRTPLKIKSSYHSLGGTAVMVLTLKTLPVQTYPGLLEKMTSSPEINFPISIKTHFRPRNRDKKIAEFENTYKGTLSFLSNNSFTTDEVMRAPELEDICKELKVGIEKCGELGFSVKFSADTIQELRRRRSVLDGVLRSLESMEAFPEWVYPANQLVSTLPCAATKDRRTKVALSRDAVGIAPLTGANRGVKVGEAIDVLGSVSGGLFYFNPGSSEFNSGMTLLIGSKRSGKSGMLLRQTINDRLENRLIVYLDFGGSSTRICEALGGVYTDITRARGLGLFDIKAKANESFQADELNENGFPLARLAEVQQRLEILCLNAGELELDRELSTVLRDRIDRTYARLEDVSPIIDDFIHTLEMSLDDHSEQAKKLAARLKIYASGGSLGHLLNDRESAPIDLNSPLRVFDFRGALDDPRLMLVGTMAVDHYIKRLLRTDRRIKKSIKIDEFGVIAQDWRLCKMVEIITRTDSKSNCIASISTQDAADLMPTSDLTTDPRRAIRASAEILWLFYTPKPTVAQQCFNLSNGTTKLLGSIDRAGGESHRDCVLVYPKGTAHLRLKFNALEKRLCLGAGRERATLEAALSEASHYSETGGVPPRLLRALSMDALSGTGTGVNLGGS